MRLSGRRVRTGQCILASVVALTAACTVNEVGAIPCNDDSNCPADYSQCASAGSSAGRCIKAVVGTPAFAAGGGIVVAPASITGGNASPISLSLPALAGDLNLARKVKLEIDSGGAPEAQPKSDGTAVVLSDLGKTIAVATPVTNISDSKTYRYTLTVSNQPSSSAIATATGTLIVYPAPVLASSTLAIAPAAITGGLSATLSVGLPALSSPSASAGSVVLAVAGCGSGGAVSKSDGSAITSADLGTTINVAAPPSVATDNKTCTYTLTVSNAASTPAVATATGTLTIAPFEISAQPVNATAHVGGSASFSVTATTLQGTLSYQWQKDGVPLAGKTASVLTLNPVVATDAGMYTVVVSSTFNGTTISITSNAASLNVAPVITSQPAAQTSLIGGSAGFTVSASVSQGALSYQWQKDGTAISGQTGASLTVSPVAVSDAGIYTVIVTSTFNGTTVSTTSNGAALIVNQPPAITVQPLASQTVPQNTAASFSVTANAQSAGATLTYQWKKGSTNLTNGGKVSGATTASLTLSAVTAADEGTYSVVVTSNLNATAASVTSNGSVLTVNQTPTITSQPQATQTVAQGGTATFSVTATANSAGATLSYQWKKGSTALTDGGNVSGSTSATLTLTNVAGSDAATYTVVVTSNLNGTAAPVTSGNAVLVVNQTPVITVPPPASQTIPEGTAAGINVMATAPSAGATLSYQWKKGSTNLTDGGNVSGATTANLTLSGVTAADQATYTVVVTSNLNSTTASVTSSGSTLIVNQTPSITTQPPASQTVAQGGTASFSVSATATSPGATLSYQWKKGGTALTDGGNVSGSTTATLSLSNVQGSDAATYTVVVTSNLNSTTKSITSGNSILVVNVPPTINTQPSSQAAAQGAGASFTVAATPSGGATLSYQWQKNGSSLANGGNVSGATTASLTLATVGLSDVALYSVVVTSTLNATTSPVTSNSVALTVDNALNSGIQRVGATATLLPNGKVLIAGGGRKSNTTTCTTVTTNSATVEIFDPATGVSTQLGGATPAANQKMSIERCQHAAVLAGTSVYFFGGANTTNVDVFDTGTQTFLTTGLPTMNAVRLLPTATLLGASSGGNSGKIVIAGGYNATNSATLNSIELFTPGGSSTTYTAKLGGGSANSGRADHTATLVGKWLFFIGGIYGTISGASSSVDAIDTSLSPTGGGAATIVNSTPSSNATVRWGHSAVALSSGSAILLMGGLDASTTLLNTVQTYAVDTTTGSAGGAATANVNMANARAYFPVLQRGTTDKFVVFGGTSSVATTDLGSTSVELIDATNANAIAVSSYHGDVALSVARQESAAVLINNGGAFFVAGGDPGGAAANGTHEVIVDQ